MYTTDTCVAGIGDNRHREPDLGLRCSSRIGEVGEVRNRVVRRVEPVNGDAAEIIDRRLGACVDRAVGDPNRRVVARGIKGLQGGRVLRATADGIELAAETS